MPRSLVCPGGWERVRTIILRYLGEDMDATGEALASRGTYGGDHQDKVRGEGDLQSA